MTANTTDEDGFFTDEAARIATVQTIAANLQADMLATANTIGDGAYTAANVAIVQRNGSLNSVATE